MFAKQLAEAAEVAEVVPWDLHEAYGLPQPYRGGHRRKEPTYPGLRGKRYEAAKKKGYIDMGLIDPEVELTRAFKGRFPELVVEMIWKTGTAFIRDPHDLMKKGGMLKTLANDVRIDVAGFGGEQQSYAIERDDQEDAASWGDAIKKAKKAKVTVVAVKGKTGPGYKITMSPAPSKIM